MKICELCEKPIRKKEQTKKIKDEEIHLVHLKCYREEFHQETGFDKLLPPDLTKSFRRRRMKKKI